MPVYFYMTHACSTCVSKGNLDWSVVMVAILKLKKILHKIHKYVVLKNDYAILALFCMEYITMVTPN